MLLIREGYEISTGARIQKKIYRQRFYVSNQQAESSPIFPAAKSEQNSVLSQISSRRQVVSLRDHEWEARIEGT